MLSCVLLAGSLATLARAHQNFHQFWVNGVSPGYQACIRMPPSNSPVTDVASNDITCNVNGNIVPSSVSVCGAKAGDTIKVQWDSSTHPGPITHSLFGPVSNAQSATGIGSWAKIDELDYSNGQWANEIMEVSNMTYAFKLPANLASGDYLLRSEMLALHGAQTLDGAQFYIGCAQLRITGPGGVCSPTFQLPGAYKASDADIHIPKFYNGFDPTTYKAPGGPVAACGGSRGSTPKPTTSVPAKPPITSTKAPTTTLKPVTLSTSVKPPPTTVAGGPVSRYGRCGGQGWMGATVCAAGSTCAVSNVYYSQCL